MDRRSAAYGRNKFGLRSGSESSSSSVAGAAVSEAGRPSETHGRNKFGLFGQGSSSTDHLGLPASPKRKAENAELTSGVPRALFLDIYASLTSISTDVDARVNGTRGMI